jgi:ribosomal protein S18 acetylase RimI-like enzyme
MDTTLIPPPAAAADYTWRPATHADLPAIHGLLLANAAAADDPRVPTLDDYRREFDDPWCDPATSTRLVLAPDGSVAALARVVANPEPLEEARAFLEDEVHPDHADQLYDLVLDWLVERGSQRLRDIAAAQPGGFAGPLLLRLGAFDNLPGRQALYERHGFRPVRYFYRMCRDLRRPIPDRPLPDGLTVTTYRAELAEAVRQADNEAFSDHWSHEPVSANDWQQFIVGNSAFRPDLTPVVLDGDEVVAFSLNRVSEEENARQGYTAGWVGSLGTRRAWRKRGLASALLVWSMRAFQAEGLAYAVLGVDAENPTGALGLYERLGFVSERRINVYERAVTGPD